MTDPLEEPLEERLRRAMRSGVAGFSTAGGLGETRGRLVQRVRRRRRQVAGLAAAGLFVVSGAAVALAAGNPGSSPSRQIAAQGAPGPTGTTDDQPSVVAGAVGGGTAVSVPGSGAGTVVPVEPVTTGRGSTTLPQPPATVPVVTLPPNTTVVTTAPPTTTVPITMPAAGVSMVQGTVRFSPVCPVESVPPNPACAPRPGAAHIQLVRGDGTVAAQGDAGSNGAFAIPVAPGSYTVRATPVPATAAIGRGCVASPAVVTVPARAIVTVAVSCDTGIR